MFKTYMASIFVLMLTQSGVYAMTKGSSQCKTSLEVGQSSQISVKVASATPLRGPIRLGLNLESVPFERSFWDHDKRQVDVEVTNSLKDIPGTVLRYPGGAVSNRIDMLGAIGEHRTIQALEHWLKPSPVAFGPMEYAHLTELVGAKAWLVLNILGSESKRISPDLLAARNVKIVDLFTAKSPLLNVELGNELYLPRHKMTGAEYAERLLPTLKALRDSHPGLRPVVGLAAFDMGPMRAAEFNRGVLDKLENNDVDFSLHYYYDGPPGGPPLPSALRNLCDHIDWLKKRRGAPPRIWITEHGRWPGGKVDDPDWQLLWPNTRNLGAALSVAEFIIAVSSLPEVEGIFLHSLAGGKSPWTVLQRDTATDKPVKTAPLLAYELLHGLSQDTRIESIVMSPVLTNRPVFRAAVTLSDTGVYSVSAVHRGVLPSQMRLTIPAFAGRHVTYELRHLSGNSESAQNTADAPTHIAIQTTSGQVMFTQSGEALVEIPALSVFKLVFQ